MPRYERAVVREFSPFIWSDGIRVAHTSIWCDAARARELSFLSHATVPLPKGFKGGKLLATARTLQFRRALGAPLVAEVLTTPYCRPFAMGRARLQLLPSGFLPGSAQLHVELPKRSLLYSGAIGASRLLEPGTVEPLQVRAADCIVFDAPLAPYLSALPPRAQVEADLLSSLDGSLSRGRTVLLWTPLIDSDEVTTLVVRAGMRVRLHPRIAAFLSACERLEIPSPQPRPLLLRGAPKGGEVVVWPFEKSAPRAFQGHRVDRFLVGGHALQQNAAGHFGVEWAFAYSRHADLPNLIAHALAVGAKLVFLSRGYTVAVAQVFAKDGIEARPLGPPAQMMLFRAPQQRTDSQD